MLAHRLRRWANINPVLGYRVVFRAALHVGYRHRRRATINPILVQNIWLYYTPSMQVRHNEVLTRKNWILASTGDAGPTLNRHWVGVGL